MIAESGSNILCIDNIAPNRVYKTVESMFIRDCVRASQKFPIKSWMLSFLHWKIRNDGKSGMMQMRQVIQLKVAESAALKDRFAVFSGRGVI